MLIRIFKRIVIRKFIRILIKIVEIIIEIKRIVKWMSDKKQE
jgi:hypothetical protein